MRTKNDTMIHPAGKVGAAVQVILVLVSLCLSLAPFGSASALQLTPDTVADVAAPVITEGPTVVAVSNDKAVITWRTDEPANARVAFGIQGQSLDEVKGEIRYAKEHLIVLTNLQASTTYSYQVSSSDPSGNGPVSSAVMAFTTTAQANMAGPVFIAGPTVTTSGTTQALITWTTDNYATSSVLYDTAPGTFSYRLGSEGLKTTHSVILTSLIPCTTYYYKVVSADAFGNTAESSANISFMTPGCSSFAVTPSAGAGGSFSPDTVQTVTSGATTTFTITPDTGYSIDSVTGCGGMLNSNTYTTGSITGACTVSASFTLNQYLVSASTGTGGTITPSSWLVNHGSITTFMVAPNAGYTAIVGGTCDGSLDGNTYTTSAITSNCVVSASFILTVTKPTAPSGLKGVKGSNVDLSWTDNASNEAGYRVYRRLKTVVAWTMITDIGSDSTSYTDTTAAADTTYQYRVAAYNAAGASASSVITVTTDALLPPDSLNAEIVGNGPSVALLWRDNSTSEDGYQVFRRNEGDADWVSIATLPASSTIHTDLTSSTRVLYRYQVCATTNAGGSACSVVDGVNGPSSLVATQSSGSTHLTWTDNSDDETDFRVHRKEATEATWSVIGSVGANTTSFTDSTASPDTTYDYYVRAHNSAAASRSHTVRFTTGNLAPPTLSSVASLGTQADLAWNDNAGTEDGYSVWKRSAAVPQWTAVNALPADSTHATDAGLTAGVLYAYQVCATTAAGGNACSGIKAGNLPTGFAVSYNAGTGAILNWLDNASDEAGYRVFRKAAGETAFTVIKILDRDSTSLMDPSVVPGAAYQFRVCAFNAVASSCTPVAQLLVP